MASTFNKVLIQSVEELAQNCIASNIVSIPIDIDKPVFRIEEISELEVENTINSLRNSKAKDAFGLDSVFFKTHKQSLIKPITHFNQFIN